MTTLTFDQVLTAIRQLPPHERAQLMAVVVTELAPPPATESWSWAQLEAFITDFQRAYPNTDPAAQVLVDRRARDGVNDDHA